MSQHSSTELVITARARTLVGGLEVRRVLPVAARRAVGPFVFLDHMGPVALEPGRGVDVPPHPHIGLATLTYLFEGESMHRDSLGSEQLIGPGAVNWMSAGRGIAHSERSTQAARQRGIRMHGLQLWVALPLEHEEDAPSFEHHAADTLPELDAGGVRLRVLAGSAYGARSPVRVRSPLFYVEAVAPAGSAVALPDEHDERALYVVEGTVEHDGERHGPGTMLVFRKGMPASVLAAEPARLALLGGAPLDAPRHIFWNFVSSSKERIERAKRDWSEGRFAPIPGDDQERVPLPG
jgi:hypothetical protein